MATMVITRTDWDKAANDALRGLEDWQARFLNQIEKTVWPYEYQQVSSAIEHVKILIENLKGDDDRTKQ